MKNVLLWTLMISVIGCGGPDWEGTFVGKLLESGSCSDGSSIPETETAVELTLRDEGDRVSWEAACGATVLADVDGDVADLRQASCPAETVDGITRSTTIEEGTLTLNDDLLELEMELSISVSGTVNGNCNATAEGTLRRLAD